MTAAFVAALVLFLASPADAGDDSRVIHGHVDVATPKGVGADLARCARHVGRSSAQGHLGHLITLRPAEGDGTHWLTLSPRDSLPNPTTSNFDVYLYESLGSCTEPPVWTGAANADHHDDEYTRIPLGTRYALVVRVATPPSYYSCYSVPCPVDHGDLGWPDFTARIDSVPS